MSFSTRHSTFLQLPGKEYCQPTVGLLVKVAGCVGDAGVTTLGDAFALYERRLRSPACGIGDASLP
ncbi:MAG: hypothetical protein FWD31_02725 [Planctomycetaceae bacterium]|nr:hypothetical protein [Planctomycetaceae bacterium]